MSKSLTNSHFGLYCRDHDGNLIVYTKVLKRIQKELNLINSYDIENIKWYEKGSFVDTTPESVKSFKYTGLNNQEFILSNFQGVSEKDSNSEEG